MSQPHDPERLRALEERIDAVKGSQAPKTSRGEEHFSQANMAWRMVVELVTGLLLGFAIGYGLDSLFGTTPILMVVFIGFGFVAGIKTMMRTAGEIQRKEVAKASEAQTQNNAGTPANDERDERT